MGGVCLRFGSSSCSIWTSLKALVDEYFSNMLVSNGVYDVASCNATYYSKTGYIQGMI